MLRHLKLLSLVLLLSCGASAQILIHDIVALSDTRKLVKARLLRLDRDGRVTTLAQNPRVAFTYGSVVTPDCVWLTGATYNPTAERLLGRAVPVNFDESVSCIDKQGKSHDVVLPNGIYALAGKYDPTTGNTFFGSSAYAQVYVVNRARKVSVLNYRQLGVASTANFQGQATFFGSTYIHRMGVVGAGGFLAIDRKTLALKALVNTGDDIPHGFFQSGQHLAVVTVNSFRKYWLRIITFDRSFRRVGSVTVKGRPGGGEPVVVDAGASRAVLSLEGGLVLVNAQGKILKSRRVPGAVVFGGGAADEGRACFTLDKVTNRVTCWDYEKDTLRDYVLDAYIAGISSFR